MVVTATETTDPNFDTSEFFTPGRLSVILDGQAGSSGKGVIGDFITKHAVGKFSFVCNAFSAQAGHWVKPDNSKSFFYQTLNSCAHDHNRFCRMLIGPDALIDLDAFWREMRENQIPWSKVGIHPLVGVIQPCDSAYERGELNFDGGRVAHSGTAAHGSTCHGVGAARARRLLRRPDVVLARDLPELNSFICDVPREIMNLLDSGQAGLLEVGQGFQLSLAGRFYPACTSRNVTVSAALDGMMLPPRYLGNILLNFRTCPIRISSSKYRDPMGQIPGHLTWQQVEDIRRTWLIEPIEDRGNSGGWYPDQMELTWAQVTQDSGSPTPISELTSVTKLPRRVATFSTDNLREAIRYNGVDSPFSTFLRVNFVNYVDHQVSGVRGHGLNILSSKVQTWLRAYVEPVLLSRGVVLRYLGTGPLSDDHVVV